MTVSIEYYLGDMYGLGTKTFDGAEESYECHEHQL